MNHQRDTAAARGCAPGRPATPASWRSAVEHRQRFLHVLGAARVLLVDEPSAHSRRAAAGRIARAVLALADQLNDSEVGS